MYNRERLDRLFEKSRQRAVNPPVNYFECNFHELALGEYKELPLWERIARSMAGAIIKQPVYIDADDRIIGRVYHSSVKKAECKDPEMASLTMNDAEIFHEGYRELFNNQLAAFNCPGHIAWDWNSILRFGTAGIKRRCELGLRRRNDEKSIRFYSGVLILIEALEKWNKLHVNELRRLGLDEMAEICEKVPERPAESFHEAVQSFFMQYIVVMMENPYGGNSPGRLDYYLWPYLEADIKAGRCTLDDARELISELFMRIDERIHKMDGWVESLAIGGSHSNGSSAINPLTYIMIEEAMKLNITHPAVYVRLPKDAPEDFTELCARYFKNGGNRAQLLSDEAIIKALMLNDVPYSDAVDYFCGGCMEIGIQGKTADFLFVGYQNIAKFVELSVTGGFSLTKEKQVEAYSARPLTGYADFESFYSDFIGEFRRITNIMFRWQDKMSEREEDVRPAYLISSMIDSCLQRGRNMHGGGAKYYDYGLSVIGLANAADSLYAIKRAVFEDKLCTAEELLAALKANFEGYESLRSALIKLPKYGQDDASADAMMRRLCEDIADIYRSYENRFGGNGKLVILTFIWAERCGSILGASADGRLSGRTVAQGVTPQGSSMKCGITAAINSCTSIPFEVFAGGASSMWDLDEAFASEKTIAALFKAFFAAGGQIFQGNTTDVKALLAAKEKPDEYYNLIVRVGGYSARFVTLTPEIQDEIINRVRHSI